MLPNVVKPVQLLYHGTSVNHSVSIEQEGIRPVNYNRVYLTADIYVAFNYACNKQVKDKDYSGIVICIVDAQKMYMDGFEFTHEVTHAEYTVESVPPQYLLQVIIESEEELELFAQYALDYFNYS